MTLQPAQQLTDAQRSAIRSACRGDYQQVCANVPTGTKDSLQCLLQHSQQVSPGCREALAPAATATSGTAPAASSATAPAPAAAAAASASSSGTTSAAAPLSGSPLSPRQQAMALRSSCGGDFHKFCSDVQAGGGRAVACLRAHAADLSPACRAALSSAAAH
jgi:Cysteine rich repeat